LRKFFFVLKDMSFIELGTFFDLVKRSLHKKDFTQMPNTGVWGHSPQQVEVHAEGMVSKLASDPCRRHVLQLVLNVKQNGFRVVPIWSSLPLLFWEFRVPHFWIPWIKKAICLSNNFTKQWEKIFLSEKSFSTKVPGTGPVNRLGPDFGIDSRVWPVHCGNPRTAFGENPATARNFSFSAITDLCSSEKVSPLLSYHLNTFKYGFLSIFYSVFSVLCTIKVLSLCTTHFFLDIWAYFRTDSSIFGL
jgi:hypothetical protein